MKVNIFNVDKFVQTNNLQEVSDPVLLERDNSPTSNGLFSYEIFGRPGSQTRKSTFAYIDLKGNYFHPLVYKTLKRIDRKFDECISSTKTFIIDETGQLVEDENGDSGVAFLYKNWNKIRFKTNDSRERTQRVKMIQGLRKDEIFMTKQLVIPPFYRDINLLNAGSGKLGHDPINDMYNKLIRLAHTQSSTTEEVSGFDFLGNMTRLNIQNTILDVYDYFLGYIKGKNGIFRQAVMGKSIDYGARLVLSSAVYNTERYDDMKVSFEYTGVPLAQVLTIFFPFIIKFTQDWFQKNFGNLKVFERRDKKTGEKSQVVLKDPIGKYNHEKITKYIKRFIKTPSERFTPITIDTEDGDEIPVSAMYHILDDSGNVIESRRRHITWTDLMYQIAIETVKDKHVYITRYPLEDYMCIYPSKVQVLTTFETERVKTENDQEYKFYPKIDLDLPNERVSSLFIDSLQVFNGMLKAIGGWQIGYSHL